jgi:putative DNA primase/helicase
MTEKACCPTCPDDALVQSSEPANTPPTSPAEPEIERPGFATHDDWFAIAGEKLRPGLYWHGWTKPKGDAESQPIDSWISSPIHAVAMTEGENGDNHGLFLRFMAPNGRWREWAAPMMLLKGSGEELRGELLNQGVRIDPRNRAQLAQWLMQQYPHERIIAATHTGWHDGAFVLPGQTIGDAAVRFQSEHAQHDDFVRKGALNRWRDQVAAPCRGNPMLVLAVSTALAGPLLHSAKLQTRGGAILHLMGDSSRGKSTAVQVAASVWGAPQFVRTWRATGNGLEAAAAALNDTVLILDEIGECDPREIGGIVYMVGNGSGKSRAARTGGARKQAHWRLMALSNGEHSLATHIASVGQRSKAGQEARMLDIPVTGRAHGVFDTLQGIADGRTFADTLTQAAALDYGHAGPAFIEKLLAEDEDLPAFYAELCERPEFQSRDSISGRAAKWFALVAMAGELAAYYGVTPWPEGEAIHAAITAFDLWREHRGPGQTEDRQIRDAIRRFINRHGDARFSCVKDSNGPRVHDRAGYWRDAEQGRIYLFHSDALTEAAAGYGSRRVLDALESAGWLAGREDASRSVRITVAGDRKRFYAVRPAEEDE